MKIDKVTLNRREVEAVYELFNKFNESGDCGSVVLTQESGSGIGSTLTATFLITHQEVYGDFTINITDESSW